MLKLRNITSVLIISLILGNYPLNYAVFAEVPIQIAESIWKPFTSTEDGFTILMPITPTVKTQNLNLNNSTITSKIFSAYSGYASYGIAVRYYSQKDSDIKPANKSVYFDLVLSEIINNYNVLKRRRNITLNGYPGQEVEIEMTTDTGVKLLKRRMYVVNNKVYIMGVSIPIEMRISFAVSTADFFNSFKLLNQ